MILKSISPPACAERCAITTASQPAGSIGFIIVIAAGRRPIDMQRSVLTLAARGSIIYYLYVLYRIRLAGIRLGHTVKRTANNGQIDHGTRRSALVRKILGDVFARLFEPGQRMRVEHLAGRYGVSATPVREALVELAGMGIVKLQPNRGAELRPFGPRQLREIYQLRSILESEAVRGDCGRIAPFELRSLEQELTQLIKAPKNRKWSDHTQAIDTRLHELIAERCGNERLAHEITRYRDLYRSLRDIRHGKRKSRSDYAQMNENIEHLSIVRALLSGDADRAARAMTRHIESAATALQKELFDADSIAASSTEPFLTPSDSVV